MPLIPKALPALLAAVCVALLAAAAARAQETPIPAPPQLGASGYILMDATSGTEIAASNPDERLEPASLTKLMTAYVAFAALREGTIGLGDQVYISEKAWQTSGSRMFIEVGTQVVVEDLMRGMIIQSGNDASVALAEHIAGTEESFADLMNQYAARLGMTNTSYRNSTGLPADGHYSTARDSAILARAIVTEYPDYYAWYSEREFTYNGIRQHNRNSLLWRDDSVDGLKTGHTDAAGYCLVSSAERDGMRLVSVVMGMSSPDARADGSYALLNYGFRFFETFRMFAQEESVTEARVYKGEPQQLSLGVDRDLYVTAPRGRRDSLDAVFDLPQTLVAPVGRGAEIGELRVSYGEEVLARAPLIALHDVSEGSLWTRLVDSLELWFE